MRRRYVTCDVFTGQAFGGNPLAVVLDAEGLSDAQMQSLACEFNYSETTFVLPPRDADHTARVRIFTPRAEIPFAGHPNVGTACMLSREPAFRDRAGRGEFVFEETAGPVRLTLVAQHGLVIGAEFLAPEPLSRRSVMEPKMLAALVALEAHDIDCCAHAPQVVSVGLPFVVAAVSSRAALSRAKPSLAAFSAALPLDGADAVYLYRRCGASLDARMFSPLDGIVEDPATGSATAATLALLASLDKVPSEREWRVRQGEDMGRPSLLRGRTRRHADRMEVFVGGHCRAMFEGSFDLS